MEYDIDDLIFGGYDPGPSERRNSLPRFGGGCFGRGAPSAQFAAFMDRKALMKPSRSPSITLWMLPFSYSVR